ncbi:MAG: LruC domain-containing protein [Pseudomonadales bacterium]|nr:LruC domain-containing protein [Pseudomonadales bacterium]
MNMIQQTNVRIGTLLLSCGFSLDGNAATSAIDIVGTSTICLSVGLSASITELDNFSLDLQTGVDGDAYSAYAGSDEFHLESNGGVAVQIQNDKIFQQSHSIDVNYNINNSSEIFTTQENEAFAGDLTLNGYAYLTSISAQLAGNYAGSVTLTVVPVIGGIIGCGGEVSYPANSQELWATLAWEDLYPNPGDADYNDLVVNFRILENYDVNNNLQAVQLDFVPVGRGAGYDHALMLSLDGILDDSVNVSAETTPVISGNHAVQVVHTNLVDNTSFQYSYSSDQDLVIFDSTKDAMGAGFANVYETADEVAPIWMTSVSIDLPAGGDIQTNGLISGDFNYRPFIHVHNTNQDIDLYQVNPLDGMIDDNGYPFGLMMPLDWSWPNERVAIEAVYPLFEDFRGWLSGDNEMPSEQALNWYQYPIDNHESISSNINLFD